MEIPDKALHYTHNSGWLRAAVLGANDGIVSVASLLIGMSAAGSTLSTIFLAGTAGLVAGALSMAAGEFVSVSSQADTERADLRREKEELENHYEHEVHELAEMYAERGVEPELARKVAEQLMAHDALGTHAREELGITDALTARPLQAAFSSALAFVLGAGIPVIASLVIVEGYRTKGIMLVSLICLAILGAASAKIGGAGMLRAVLRVTFWGALAMGLTALVGHLVGVEI
jgi:VIT1/CCC1 family predicted Fe2+/Mn2+ transporter